MTPHAAASSPDSSPSLMIEVAVNRVRNSLIQSILSLIEASGGRFAATRDPADGDQWFIVHTLIGGVSRATPDETAIFIGLHFPEDLIDVKLSEQWISTQ